jgi:Na+/H+ antiporter NhaD/arsenite permease-like protein
LRRHVGAPGQRRGGARHGAASRGRRTVARPRSASLPDRASNAGSAATLIGNPQNILLGQVGNLSFHIYFLTAIVPALVGLVAVFGVTWFLWHGRIAGTVLAVSGNTVDAPRHPYDRNQTIKGLGAMVLLLILFMTPLPRETGALLIAAVLLANRKFTSRIMIAAVDWPLLLLFVCLFAVTGALAGTTLPATIIAALQDHGLLPDNLLMLTPLTLLMSNIFGNVPSVILLLQVWPNPPQGMLYALGILSSLAGNLLLVGSLSNIIVMERAASFGVRISFGDYARAGVPATIISLAFAMFWLTWMGWLPFFPGTAVAAN